MSDTNTVELDVGDSESVDVEVEVPGGECIRRLEHNVR